MILYPLSIQRWQGNCFFLRLFRSRRTIRKSPSSVGRFTKGASHDTSSHTRKTRVQAARQRQYPVLSGGPLSSRTQGDGESVAGQVFADLARRMEAAARPAGSGQPGAEGRRGAPSRSPSPSPRAHGAVSLHLLPGLGARHGGGSGGHSVYRRPRAMRRRLPSGQLPGSRHPGEASHLRHQRPR